MKLKKIKKLKDYTEKPLEECTILELYNAALALTQDACKGKVSPPAVIGHQTATHGKTDR